MPDIRKECCWSEGALAARPLFKTPELTAITRRIKSELDDFFRRGEGYHTTTIPFILFKCEFVLIYSFEEEIWILEIFVPPTGPQGPGPNLRGRHRNGYERSIIEFFEDFAPIWEDWCGAAGALVYNIARLLGPMIAAFCADIRVRQGIVGELKSFIAAMFERFTPSAHRTDVIAVRSSHGCEEVVPLVQKPLGNLLTFFGLVWAWERPLGLPGQQDPWDTAWFGPLQEVSV